MFPINERLLTPNRYSRPERPIDKVLGIVIHWTANESNGADAEGNRMYFENRKHGRTGYGSAHYIIDSTEIVRCIPDNEMAYHVGATSYKTTRFGSYPNGSTIGIEMCVNADGNFKVVYQQTMELAARLLKQYNLNPDTDLVRHFDVTGKNCPAYFTSDHWGSVNNSYAIKYGLGSNADNAWEVFKSEVKKVMTPQQPIDTSKGIGAVDILASALNIRTGPGLEHSVAKVAYQGERFYAYGESSGMYDLGSGLWCSANPSYVKFTPHPVVEKPMFPDVPSGHWAKEAIESIAKKGIVSGRPDGTFAPDLNMTRAQMAAVVNNVLKYIEKHYQVK